MLQDYCCSILTKPSQKSLKKRDFDSTNSADGNKTEILNMNETFKNNLNKLKHYSNELHHIYFKEKATSLLGDASIRLLTLFASKEQDIIGAWCWNIGG